MQHHAANLLRFIDPPQGILGCKSCKFILSAPARKFG
jgi:hypothetical protein